MAWTLWAALALGGIGVAAWKAWLVLAAPDPTPASRSQLLTPLAIIGIIALVWLSVRASSLWRRGPPWKAWPELRRERQLARLIRSLADDPHTGIDGETIEEFAAYAELGWLEDIAAHLAAQPLPRSLRLAMEATDRPEAP